MTSQSTHSPTAPQQAGSARQQGKGDVPETVLSGAGGQSLPLQGGPFGQHHPRQQEERYGAEGDNGVKFLLIGLALASWGMAIICGFFGVWEGFASAGLSAIMGLLVVLAMEEAR